MSACVGEETKLAAVRQPRLRPFGAPGIQSRRSRSSATFRGLRRSSSDVFVVWYFPSLVALHRVHLPLFFPSGEGMTFVVYEPFSHNTQPDGGQRVIQLTDGLNTQRFEKQEEQ